MTPSLVDRLQARVRELEDRNEELKDLLGLNINAPCVVPFTKKERHLVGLLTMREMVTKDMAFAALYGDLPESDHPSDPGIITVYMWKIGNKLRDHGVIISMQRGVGWYLKKAQRAKLKALLEERP